MLKDKLLENKLIWEINRELKAFQVEKKYKEIYKHYDNIQLDENNEILLKEKGWDKIKKHDLKVFYLGTDPLQDFGGFIQALEKKCDLKLFYKRDGSYGQYSRGNSRNQNIEYIAELLSRYKQEQDWTPDILMMQSYGFNISIPEMQILKELYGFKIINIGMDERLAYKLGMEKGYEKGISGLNDISDLVLVTTPECVSWYLKEGIPAFYFPLASNETVYFPIENIKKKYDVGFIGRNYGLRAILIKYLIKHGINIKAYGPGWENGELDVTQNNEFYNSCRIIIGTGNIGYSKKLMNPKLRDLEVPLTKTLYITNYTSELGDMFLEDKQIVFYRNKKDLLKKIKFYLINDIERETIAKGGYDKAIMEHTYNLRLESIFNKIFK